MAVCDYDKDCVGLAVLTESISHIKETIENIREDIKHLSVENSKRHEEGRDCFYLAESTCKKLDEVAEELHEAVEKLHSQLIDKEYLEHDQIRAEQNTIRTEIDGLRSRISSLESVNESKIWFIVKTALPYIIGIATGIGIFKWPF